MTSIERLAELIDEVEEILVGIEEEMAQAGQDSANQLEYRSYLRHRDELRRQLVEAEKELVVA